MGLTLHYRLTAPASLTARSAAAIVRRLHPAAGKFAAAGRIAAASRAASSTGEAAL